MPSAIQIVDQSILLWIQSNLRLEPLNPIIKAFTSLGNAGMLWIIISLLMLCSKRTRRIGFISILALLFSLIVTNLCLKPFIDRARPYTTIHELVPLFTSSDPHSFPSGHTSAAFAAGIVWAKLFPQPFLKVLAVLQAILMGLSRLYVGVHYPTDVLFGAIIGTFCAIMALVLAEKNKSLNRLMDKQL